jgi:hypothetical protein
MDTDMQYGHGHAAWTWTHSTALVMQSVSGSQISTTFKLANSIAKQVRGAGGQVT